MGGSQEALSRHLPRRSIMLLLGIFRTHMHTRMQAHNIIYQKLYGILLSTSTCANGFMIDFIAAALVRGEIWNQYYLPTLRMHLLMTKETPYVSQVSIYRS